MNVPLICDYGSGFSKVGFAGTEAPLAVFPTILGKLRHEKLLVGMEEEDWFIGNEVPKNQGKLNLLYPVSRAAITNWDDMEKEGNPDTATTGVNLEDRMLSEMGQSQKDSNMLHVAPEQHPLLMAEPPLNSISSKERLSQILFETFSVPALYLANQGVLSLYASGHTAGMTIESGEGMTYFVPIIDGCPLHQSTFHMDIAGQDLTLYFLHLLSESGHSFVSTADRECARDLKEKNCFVALDFEKEKAEANSPSYPQKCQLPDGQEIDLGRERFFCPEALFQPDLIERNNLGIHIKAFECISSCNPAFWKILFGHIILSGGTGTCSGLRSRLQKETSTLVSPKINVKASTCPYSMYGAWVGGSMLCSLSTFKDMWVTIEEYREMGFSVVGRRTL
ncbi:actin isoform X2 [Bos javanicus]|uniref:actin isoform X2 n=1 Tax=Bos javanicus TaxID=9906 RepID=UPI002AA909E5|nr:actin isoform X2 [Bos javanicus]